MKPNEFDQQADLFKALSDPHRLKILSILASRSDEVCVCDFTSELPLLQPTVSHHLRVLKEAALVESERHGTWAYYKLAPDAMNRLSEALAAISPNGAKRKRLQRAG